MVEIFQFNHENLLINLTVNLSALFSYNYVYGVPVKITLYNALSKLCYNHVIG